MRDLAEAAARALATPVPGATITLNGPGWTYDDLVHDISQRLGRSVRHQTVDDDAELGPFGPVHALFRNGMLAQSPDELTRLIGRPPINVFDVLENRRAC